MSSQIFLDYNSTTPVDPVVLDRMLPWFTEQPGNAASSHALGRRSAIAVEDARNSVAQLIGARDSEIIWTSGATESNNTVIRGLEQLRPSRNRILVGATEHKAVLDSAIHLRNRGWVIDVIPVDHMGTVIPDEFRRLLAEDVALVSIMHANNETGVINQIQDWVCCRVG